MRSRQKTILMFIMMLCAGTFHANAQPVADIGLYASGSDTLVVRMIPRGFFNGVVSNVVFTLRWESGCNTSLGNVIQSGAPASYIPMTKSGTPKTSGSYLYQVFGGAGMITLSSIGASWTNGVPVTLLKIPVSGTMRTFEIINDAWTGETTNNGSYFVSLNGLQKTGIIIQGSHTFITAGSASICQGDSILLGGIYRKYAGSYFDTLQGSSGCDSIVYTTLTVLPLPAAMVTPSAYSICTGSSVALTANGGTSYSWSNGSSSSEITVSPASTTTYTVTVTNAGGCTATVTSTINVGSGITASISPSNPAVCPGQSIMLTASGGSNYSWSTGATTPSINVSPLSATTYSVTVTDGGSCSSTASKTVTVNTQPSPSITPVTASVCEGASMVLTASGGSSYLWNNGSTGSSIVVSPSSTTVYSVTATSSSGCTASVSRTVTVNPIPAVSINPLHPSICEGASVTLTASGGTSYSWSNGSSGSGITVSPSLTTIYTVTVTNASGCTTTASSTVTVGSGLTATISPSNPVICSGRSIVLTASGGTNYSWNTGATSSAISVNPPFTTTYTVTVTDGGHCSATTSKTVTVHALPTASISPVSVFVCSGTSATLTASEGVSYLWNTGLPSASITVTPLVSTTYTVTVASANGCTASASRTINVHPLPVVSISPASPAICSGETVTLSASSGMSSYSWSNGALTRSNTVSPAATTTYSVTVENSNGCTATATNMVSVKQDITVTVHAAICQGDSYFAGGMNQNVPGTYQDVFTAANGCDSTVVTHLSMYPVYSVSVYPSICEGSAIIAGGDYRTQSGIYYDTLLSRHGCDSVIATHLTVEDILHMNRNITLCPGDGIFAGGGFRTVSGTYYDTLFSSYGCDSVLITRLVVLPPLTSSQTASICSGESYFAGGAWRSTPGTYYDTLSSQIGCDSVVSTTLLVHPVHSRIRHEEICEGERFYAGGALRHSSGIYYDTLTSQHGCDSVLITQLAVLPASVTHLSPVICGGSVYFAGGENRSASGIFFDTLTGSNGCDSIVVTHLTVLPDIIYFRNIMACHGETVFAGGGNQSQSGIYYDTLASHNGCDSVVITHLSFQDAIITRREVKIFGGESYFSGGAEQTETGIYYDTLLSESGCDSMVITSLFVINLTTEMRINPHENTITVRAVVDRNYADNTYGNNTIGWDDQRTLDSLIISDNMRLALHDANGAKRLDFRMDYISPSQQVASGYKTLGVTGGEGLLIAGNGANIRKVRTSLDVNFNELGYVLPDHSPPTDASYSVNPAYPEWIYEVWYEATISLSAFGAAGFGYPEIVAVHSSPNKIDATVETILPPPCPRISNINIEICEGESYFAGGAYQTVSGTYFDTLVTAAGCSVILVSQLRVLPGSLTLNYASICEGDSLFIAGAYRKTSGTYFEVSNARSGCDSVIATELVVYPKKTSIHPVSICRGQNHFAGGQSRTQSGLYYDTLSDPNGCDSIVLTVLHVLPPHINSEVVWICEGEQYFASGAFRSTPGIYHDTIYTSEGCQTIRTTTLNVNPVHLTMFDLTICEGDSIFLQGAYRKEAGMYYDTFPSRNGCDSIVVTRLALSQIRFGNIHAAICEGESYFAGGAMQTSAGIYYDTVHLTSNGCDSVVVTELTVDAKYHTSVVMSICNGERYYAGGAYRTTSGFYRDTFQSSGGCDSIVTTQLIVKPRYSRVNQVTICANEFYVAGGVPRNTNDTYFDTLTAANGCDSLIITVLRVKPVYGSSQQAVICARQGYYAGGSYRYENGTYYDTLTASNGCDSIAATVLTVLPQIHSWNTVNVCQGSGYFAQGALQTAPGTYYDTLNSSRGCDSVVITRLDVFPPASTVLNFFICQGEQHFAQGRLQSQPGTYYDTLWAANGCDSIVTTHLAVLPEKRDTVAVQICSNESYFAQGAWRNTSGIYYDIIAASTGCDSTVVTVLTVHPVKNQTVHAVICEGELFYAAGALRGLSGTYHDTLPADNGCDSVITTHLAVLPVSLSHVSALICQGESYYAAGDLQTSAGTYYDTLAAANGCDSVVITQLAVLPDQVTNVSIYICDSEVYYAGGASQSASGIYYDTLVNRYGCDSIVITELTVLNSVSTIIQTSICEGEYYYAGGALQINPGIYFDRFTASNGCDSMVITQLSVLPKMSEARAIAICTGDSAFLQGAYRKVSGIYLDTLVTANGCDSILTTQLSVLPAYVTYQYYTVCSNEDVFIGGDYRNTPGTYYDSLTAASGCDSTVVSTLAVLPAAYSSRLLEICEGESRFIAGAYRTVSGIYIDTLLALNGCDSMAATHLLVHPLPVADAGADQSVCAGESITLNASGGTSYSWSTGDTSVSFSIIPSSTASYFVTVTNSFHCSATDMVTVVVNPLPVVSLTGLESEYCTNDEDLPLTGTPAGGVFLGTGITGNIFNPGSLPAGSYVIYYIYTDPVGCSGYANRTVNVTNLQPAVINGLRNSYCPENALFSMTASPAGGVFTGAGVSGSSFNPALAGSGIHIISYEHVSSGGCMSTASLPVEVLHAPAVDFEIEDAIFCSADEPLRLKAFPAGGLFSGAGVSDTLFHPAAAGTGRFTISYSFTDTNGCSSSQSQTVEVRTNPQPQITGLAGDYCLDDEETLLAGTPPGGEFSGNGVISDRFHPHLAGAGNHILSYTYTDSFLCSGSDSAEVTVHAIPAARLSGLNNEYCLDAAAVFLSGMPAGGIFSGTGVIVDVFDASLAGAGGPYPITYTYTSLYGCADADTQWVTVNPLPVLNLGKNDFVYCLNGSVIELPVNPYGGVFYGPGILNNTFDPALAGAGTHQVYYIFTDSNSCSNKITATVLVELCSGMAGMTSEEWQVFPNPFTDVIRMQASFDRHSLLQVRWSNTLGQVIYKQNFPVTPGVNTITLYPLDHLAPGVYHIELISEDSMAVKRVVKSDQK